MTVTATALAQNATLTLAGSAAETVTGLVGDIAAGSLTGALTVTTGNAADNGIAITTGSGVTSITANGASDVVAVNAHGTGREHGADACGSAAETVTGLIGNITASCAHRCTDRDHGRCRRQYDRDDHRLGGDLDHGERGERYGDD